MKYFDFKSQKKKEEKEPVYDKITLSPSQLQQILANKSNVIEDNPIIEAANGDKFYLVTLELANSIYKDVISQYR